MPTGIPGARPLSPILSWEDWLAGGNSSHTTAGPGLAQARRQYADYVKRGQERQTRRTRDITGYNKGGPGSLYIGALPEGTGPDAGSRWLAPDDFTTRSTEHRDLQQELLQRSLLLRNRNLRNILDQMNEPGSGSLVYSKLRDQAQAQAYAGRQGVASNIAQRGLPFGGARTAALRGPKQQLASGMLSADYQARSANLQERLGHVSQLNNAANQDLAFLQAYDSGEALQPNSGNDLAASLQVGKGVISLLAAAAGGVSGGGPTTGTGAGFTQGGMSAVGTSGLGMGATTGGMSMAGTGVNLASAGGGGFLSNYMSSGGLGQNIQQYYNLYDTWAPQQQQQYNRRY